MHPEQFLQSLVYFHQSPTQGVEIQFLSHSALAKLEEAAHSDGYGPCRGFLTKGGFPRGLIVARGRAVEGGKIGGNGIVEIGLEEARGGLRMPLQEGGFHLVHYWFGS